MTITGIKNMITTINESIKSTGEPNWLSQFRQEAVNKFNGLPSSKDEDWLYTDLSAITNQNIEVSQNKENMSSNADLVIVNGYLNQSKNV